MQDITGKIRTKLQDMNEQEESVKQKQAACYKSLICHELRTPLQTIILFMRQIIETLNLFSTLPSMYDSEL